MCASCAEHPVPKSIAAGRHVQRAAAPVYPEQALAAERLRRGSADTADAACCPAVCDKLPARPAGTRRDRASRRRRRIRSCAPELTASRFSGPPPSSCSPDRQPRRTHRPTPGCSRWTGSSPRVISPPSGSARRVGWRTAIRTRPWSRPTAADRPRSRPLQGRERQARDPRGGGPARAAGSVRAHRHRGLRLVARRQGPDRHDQFPAGLAAEHPGRFLDVRSGLGPAPQARSGLRALDAHVRQVLARRPHGGLRRQEQHLRRESGRRRGPRADHGRHRTTSSTGRPTGSTRRSSASATASAGAPTARSIAFWQFDTSRRARVHHDQQHGRPLSPDDLVQVSQGRPDELGRAAWASCRRPAGPSSG